MTNWTGCAEASHALQQIKQVVKEVIVGKFGHALFCQNMWKGVQKAL